MAVIHHAKEHVKPKEDDTGNRGVPTCFFKRILLADNGED